VPCATVGSVVHDDDGRARGAWGVAGSRSRVFDVVWEFKAEREELPLHSGMAQQLTRRGSPRRVEGEQAVDDIDKTRRGILRRNRRELSPHNLKNQSLRIGVMEIYR